MAVSAGNISTADGSAIVRQGGTTVVCGVRAELAPPRPEEPDRGYLVPNISIPAMCSPAFKPGPPSIAAMLAALETVSLPAASVDPDTGEISVDPTSLTALPLHCRPVSSTSCLFPSSQSGAEASLLADPTWEEEQLAAASLSVVCVQETAEVCHLRQPGGAPVSQVALQTCIAAAQQHAKTLAKAVHKVTK